MRVGCASMRVGCAGPRLLVRRSSPPPQVLADGTVDDDLAPTTAVPPEWPQAPYQDTAYCYSSHIIAHRSTA